MNPNPPASRMAKEIAEIPGMLEHQVDKALDGCLRLGRELSAERPHGFLTCARGTSEHAANFFKYVVETRAGIPVASVGPSVASVYSAPLRLSGHVCMTFSQSGGSPDLAAFGRAASAGGARTVAVVNESGSPVEAVSDMVLPVLAGPETAVAATKSFVAMLFAGLGIAAGFLDDRSLERSLELFPGTARLALDCDWTHAEVPIARAGSLFCIGRGPGHAAAGEAALKLKEVCRLHAEAYSAAEVMHGPVVLAGRNLAALLFDSADGARNSILAADAELSGRSARTFLITEDASIPGRLPIPPSGHPLLVPLTQITAFYAYVEALCRRLGGNPDQSHGLRKVTETL